MKSKRKNNAVLKEMKKNAKENNAIVKALRLVPEIKWTGNTVHDTMDKCLVGINLGTLNSGWYDPIAIQIKGVTGWFMVNQDGTIFPEARVVKESENRYRIEYMTNSAWRDFENKYRKFIEE